MTTYRGKTVKTYADGFGVWHATVAFPDSGYGNAGDLDLDRHWNAIRAAARRAIRAEILARQPGPISPVRIEVAAQDIAPSNVWFGVTFKEAN